MVCAGGAGVVAAIGAECWVSARRCPVPVPAAGYCRRGRRAGEVAISCRLRCGWVEVGVAGKEEGVGGEIELCWIGELE